MKTDQGKISPFDVVYAIDFDAYNTQSKARADFHALADCLSEKGLAILSRHHLIEQFAVEKNQNEKILKNIATTEFKPAELTDDGYEYKNSIENFFKVM